MATVEQPIMYDEQAGEGVYQKNTGMKPPTPKPGMLNAEMAEAAAKQFKKREKKIQKACAELENPPETKQGCSCVIL